MAHAPYGDSSNIEKLCCISNENISIRNIIEQQTSTIGELLREKAEIQQQYENLLVNIVHLNLSLNDTSVIDTQGNTSNTSNVVESSNLDTSNIV